MGKPDDLDFGLSEDMKVLDVRGRHLDILENQRGLYQDDIYEEEHKLDDF